MSKPFRLAILSRNKSLHSIRRLLQEAKKQNILADVIDPLECLLSIEGRSRRIYVAGRELPHYDAVLPRIGASITDYGIAVVKHFESMGVFVLSGSKGILESRDKMRSLQILSESGIRIPATTLSRGSKQLKVALDKVGSTPAVLKVLRGTQGVGVMLLHTENSLNSVLDTFHALEEDVILQEFLKEGSGKDYRIFVIGKQVVAAMMRRAPKGEFRSNIHRGGKGFLVSVPRSYKNVAIKAVDAFKLGIAGVDIMDGPNGPTLLEVNSSPGFEGIEKATGKNIASQILKFVVSESKRLKRRRRSKS
jgi:ribosomal protein S6--L-glutamate ligase